MAKIRFSPSWPYLNHAIVKERVNTPALFASTRYFAAGDTLHSVSSF
jgi:hypothetical protein